ncbi:MAG TPA: type I glyceraldehyde-3-phosphate dehydrogenase [Candidatus Krumholzibacteriaceae bacterium]|nr:type I glyceraldehyde-3-phosphate dehydrogenase [Candidatus Krumholzibacteriaceae bacterium]
MGVKVAVNGFGRTGRLALRAAIEKGSPLEFVAVNRGDAASVGHLLKYDSVHGRAPFTVEWDEENIFVDGKPVRVLYENDAEKLPWRELGVELVIDASNQYRSKEAAGKHLKAGAKKVLVAAPGTNMDCTIVLGVNEGIYDKERHHIVSNASCTTNCLATVAKVLHDGYGIESGYMSTIHAYTNAQTLLDKHSKDQRRARAGALSIIPTSTGASEAIGEVMPELKGRLDGIAFRVPTPDVSIVDLVVNLEKRATVDEINASFKAASEGAMKGIMGYSEEPLVSVDYVHSPYSSVVDALETRVNGRMAKVLAWYDNEWGYCCRLVDVAEMML